MAIALALGGGFALAGCRLSCDTGAVTDDVLTCRQLTQQGIREAEAGDWKTAEAMLARAVHASPIDADARRHHAEALWHTGQRDAAIGQMVAAIRISESVELLIAYAQMQLAAGQVELARQAAERAVALAPQSSAAYALRARVKDHLHDPQSALADYHQAMALGGDTPALSLELADLYWRLGRYQRTLANAQSYLNAQPDGQLAPRARYLAGMAYLALDRPGQAVAHLAAAADGQSRHPDLLVRLAEAQWRAGDSEQARIVLVESLQSAPTHQPSRALWEQIARNEPAGSQTHRR